ncbi:C40 family peptidase [Actinoplanes subtropicus]|uniref:C40 family peptidase n=1 Tax=Actinoplanes subtropicus TaxID=543632 RepID=UPI000A8728FE|nr:C40 family peptidase [Actinoplanes subtropicus]
MVAAAAFAITLTGAHAASAAPSTATQLDQQQRALEKVVESYDAANISLTKTKSDLQKLKASIGPAKAALDHASSQIGTIASTAYQQGRIGPMSALLSGDSSDLIDKLGYLDQIQQANQHDIDTYTQTTQTFTQRQAELNSTQAKLTAQVSNLAAQKASIQAKIDSLKAKSKAAGPSSETSSGPKQAAPHLAGSAGKAVDYAYAQQGHAYQIDGTGPEFDCSGLTMMAWKAAGYSLPHNAAAQWSAVAHISRSELAAGDLVFYDNLGHVGIYVGGNQIIDAAHPGSGGEVEVRSINRGMPIYGYGRVT